MRTVLFLGAGASRPFGWGGRRGRLRGRPPRSSRMFAFLVDRITSFRLPSDAMIRGRARCIAVSAMVFLASVLPAHADAVTPAPPEIHIQRTHGPITIDGDLSDEGWKGA